MPLPDDTPDADSATNVLLNQRDSVAPYFRRPVNINGRENPGKVLGFDATGALGPLVVPPQGTVAVMTSLRSLPTAGLASGAAVELLGYHAAGDGGGGVFWWDQYSGLADNGGTVIAPTEGGGRWMRVVEGHVNILQFGAKADGTGAKTNNTVAIQAAINSGYPVEIPRGFGDGAFAFSNTITNPNLVPIFGAGRLVFTGSGQHAFVFGDTLTFHICPHTRPSNIRLDRDTMDFADQFGGVCLFNVYQFNITVDVRNFYRGLYIMGTQQNCAYNTIHLMTVDSNARGVTLHAAGTLGCANQNTFIGGRFSTTSSLDTAVAVHAVEFICNNVNLINGNVFLNPSIELFNITGFTSCFHGTKTGTATNVASQNKVIGYRTEGTDYIVSGTGLLDNEFDAAFAVESAATVNDIINGDTEAANRILSLNCFRLSPTLIPRNDVIKVFEFGRASVVELNTGGFDWTHAPARGAWWSADVYSSRSAGTGRLLESSIINNKVNRIMGVLVDVRGIGEDHLRKIGLKAVVGFAGGRFAAVLYNAAFTKLTATSDISTNFSFGSGFFLTGSDMTVPSAELTFTFSSNVAFMFLGFVGGSAEANVKSFAAYALGEADISVVYNPNIYDQIGAPVGLPVYDMQGPRASSIPLVPAAGNYYPDGLFVQNEAAKTGQPIGWFWNQTAGAWNAGPNAP